MLTIYSHTSKCPEVGMLHIPFWTKEGLRAVICKSTHSANGRMITANSNQN